MKFCKKYQEYMLGKAQKLPEVGCQKLKKILKNCRISVLSQEDYHRDEAPEIQRCLHYCPVCDAKFFPSLVNDMSAVVSYFNERAQKLLKLHQAAGFRKYLNWFNGKLRRSQSDVSLIEEGKDLVIYALINAIAIQKLLKKYDKIHNCCKQGTAFKSQAQSMQIEILQSPWLRELMAFNINLRETSVNSSTLPESSETYYLRFSDGKPSLSCELFDAVKLDIDLTCPVCLETVFDPVSLTCGHILCQMCACSAASVTIVDGLKSAESKEKCPLCRQAGVYKGVVHMTELSILIGRSCPEYWEKRLKMERKERVRQAKEYWESQCRAFAGI
ncbi:probable E3 ubiquitin-protein ligase BAH1-like 1 [Pistacia vera]|uniref:probable E3 ubiquitin-protein ligase BAH1-like 1 n=1 Tax=Pistacia vera TaxID=55513 RepID=UPI001263CFCA|nr:probable E3 ubiquitin-protein ligase BAH1-like 1 [Pistacia vera]